MANVYDIIIRPVITERSMAATSEKKYVFEVAPTAGKIERMGAGRPGQRKSWKKAYVQLTEDSKTIEFFEGMV